MRGLRLAGYTVLTTGIALSSVASFTLIGSAVSAAPITQSAVTIAWADQHPGSTSPNAAALANLSVTVNQTSTLGHQGIDVSWTGGLGTTSSTPGHYDTNFVQIMQCWGDDTPTPEQCQFGSSPTSVVNLVGADVATRSLATYDPLFTRSAHPELRFPSDPNVYMYPFSPSRGDRTFDVKSLFDSSVTNEIAAARTGADGTGQVTFELQTSLESPHMGCGGEVVQGDGSTYPRPCWLVIVPRGDKNPDGTTPDFPPSIAGSPFTPSVWQDRIVIPLNFEQVGQSCPIGQAEQRLVGNEIVADAFTSWQPALCPQGTTYGFSMIGDGEARSQIVSQVSGASRMAFISSPLSSEERGTTSILYAPVAQSALVFAYNVDYSVLSDADPALFAKNGTRLNNLVLNQRLVAKMLTQSYRVDVPCFGAGNSVVSANPRAITSDPEFIALNPDFAAWAESYPEGLMVALGSADAFRDVWTWIRSSPDAVAFLNGTPDENGMRINPAYVSLGLGAGTPIDTFPKTDLTTCKQTTYADDPGFGSLDLRPYYGDMQETAYRTLRADANNKTSWDPFKLPPGYKAVPPQTSGSRMMISLTDASAATRFGLNVASIANASGEIVAPSDESISAAISHFVPSSVDGVLVSDPASTAAGVYPLAQVVYAAINVCPLDASTAADYAKVLDYAAGEGQNSGSSRGLLPAGYVPLSNDQRSVAQSLASGLANVDALKAGCSPAVTSTTSGSSSFGSSSQTGTITNPVPSPSASATASRGVTTDHIGLDTSAAGLGLAAGIPMCVAGPLLIHRARKTH